MAGADGSVMQESLRRPYLNIQGLIDSLSRAKAVSAVILVMTTIAGVGLSFLPEKQYMVEALLIPVEQDTAGLEDMLGGAGGLLDLAGIGLGGSGNSAQSIALLSSRRLTSNFIAQRSLMPVLFANEWDESTSNWKDSYFFDRPSAADAVEFFEEDVRTVQVDQRTGLITLSITWTDAAEAAEWAMGLVELLNREMREDAIRESEKSLDFLNRELEKTSFVELQKAIYSLIEQEVRRAMFANVREEYALKVLDPPLVPDADDYVWPNRFLFAVLGLFVGFLIVFLSAIRRMQSPLILAGD